MRFQDYRRSALLLTVLLLGASCLVGRAASPEPTPLQESPTSALGRDPEDVLQRALHLERQRNWTAAIEIYGQALEQWPSRSEFGRRRRLCETHSKLVRRYQDQSFRKVLLRLPRQKAMDLYDELLDRIETHYVDPVSLEPLVRRGLDNMEVALRDPAFLGMNAPRATPERVNRLRATLSDQRSRLFVPDRDAAEAQLLSACEVATRSLEVEPTAVILEFVYGACDALDDYTSYLTPDKLDDLYAMIDGNFVGLGIELKLEGKALHLVGVIRGGPAWDAGVKIGDLITRVGGESVVGLSLDESAGKLQGADGTAVDLTVEHRDGKTQTFRLVRRHVEVESVARAEIVESSAGVGYIQLIGFQKNSAAELDRAVTSLRGQGMRSLVLDLRGNPGGLLNVAVEIAERFIDKGPIVFTRGRAPGQSQEYRARGRAAWTMPLCVLIDHDSASASEILAGALKDYGRAVVLGERSYGKGSVQSIFALRSAPAGLKLTTAKFYSPRNQPYSEQGVEPDVLVRASAKPVAGEGDADRLTTAEAPNGDPLRDPVLAQAILQAKNRRRLNASR